MKKNTEKTNVMRLLEQKKIPCTSHDYTDTGVVSGVEVAAVLNQNPAQVYKTLVTVGSSNSNYVFLIPVQKELDLKKAARAVGEKSVSMIRQKELLPLTGYIHGGCSPVGMKKRFPTLFHESCLELETMCVSAGKVGFQVELNPAALIALVGAATADLIAEG